MAKRFVSIWFRHLATDWFTLRQPAQTKASGDLRNMPFVLRSLSHGRMVITAANATAEIKGIRKGMVLADVRAIHPDLVVMDDKPDLAGRLLKRLAEWCIRFTPAVSVDPPDGLLLDVTGCPHLWGGDQAYVEAIVKKIGDRGYHVRVALADTPGVAWAVARFGDEPLVIPVGKHVDALLPLPPEALRLEAETVDRLHKLGLHQIRQFIRMPRSSLRKRFGQHVIMRLDMASGQQTEVIEPVQPIVPYQERLPCLEPIVTATGIAIALQQLLNTLCLRLQQEQKGLRRAIFKGYRIDGKVGQIEIGTNRPSHHVSHLFKLFELKLPEIEPGPGIELFALEAKNVEDHTPKQATMWDGSAIGGLEDMRLSELIDRLSCKIGMQAIHRYLPDEHYWPERSFKPASSLQEVLTTAWRMDRLRPLKLLSIPERIDVTAPIPDYPPLLFRRNGKLHKIVRADGPERIEQEWWIRNGQHRDYYRVEDENGLRYWIFRLGHYHEKTFQWYVHGFFA